MLDWFRARKLTGKVKKENSLASEDFATRVNKVLDTCPIDANLFAASSSLIYAAIFADDAIRDGETAALDANVTKFKDALTRFKQQATHENTGTTTRDLELILGDMALHLSKIPKRSR